MLTLAARCMNQQCSTDVRHREGILLWENLHGAADTFPTHTLVQGSSAEQVSSCVGGYRVVPISYFAPGGCWVNIWHLIRFARVSSVLYEVILIHMYNQCDVHDQAHELFPLLYALFTRVMILRGGSFRSIHISHYHFVDINFMIDLLELFQKVENFKLSLYNWDLVRALCDQVKVLARGF